MATFNGSPRGKTIDTGFKVLPQSTNIDDVRQLVTPYEADLVDSISRIGGDEVRTGASEIDRYIPGLCADFNGGPGIIDWFDKLHLIPTELDLGNVLTLQTFGAEVYSSFRDGTTTVTSITNNAGAGVTLSGLPPLPGELAANTGYSFNIIVSPEGPPTIDGTIDFDTAFALLQLPILGNRIVMFPYEPEAPVTEFLKWATDVQEAASGKEQRHSYRVHPRQEFDMKFRMIEGERERRAMQNLLNTWIPRVFGLPVWHEARQSSAAVTTGALTINVDTKYGDFRVGGLAMIRTDAFTFDALEIESMTDTSLTFTASISRDYPQNTIVMPIRTALLKKSPTVQRYAVGGEDIKANFQVINNDVELADLSCWPEFDGHLLAEDANIMESKTMNDNFAHKVIVIDNDAGNVQQFTTQLKASMSSTKKWTATSLRDLWIVRQLLHALRGSQKAFWLPTFYEDMVPLLPLTNTGTTITVAEDEGYREYINGELPNSAICVALNDGRRLTRKVVSTADSPTPGEVIINVDVAWPEDIALEDIKRIEYVRLVRIAKDQATIKHTQYGNSMITVATKGINK